MSLYVIVVHIIAIFLLFGVLTAMNISEMHAKLVVSYYSFIIAPDKAAYCVFTQFRGPEIAIELISVRTKTQ